MYFGLNFSKRILTLFYLLFRWSYSSYSTEYGNWSCIRWWFQSKFYTQFSTQLWYGGTTWKCSRFKRIPAHVDRPILQRGLGPSNCWTWFSPNDQKTPTKAEKTTGKLVYDVTLGIDTKRALNPQNLLIIESHCILKLRILLLNKNGLKLFQQAWMFLTFWRLSAKR